MSEKPPESVSLSDGNEIEKEKCELNQYISEITARIEAKRILRNENVACTRPPEEFFSKLDSSLKKNTTFVKKLRQFTGSQLESLLKDMASLNLTKYISEVCAAIVEAKLKMTDVASAVILCSKLYQTYPDFSQFLFENWQKALAMKLGEKIQNPSKMRVDLRLFAELLSAGIFNNKVSYLFFIILILNVNLGDCLIALNISGWFAIVGQCFNRSYSTR